MKQYKLNSPTKMIGLSMIMDKTRVYYIIL